MIKAIWACSTTSPLSTRQLRMLRNTVVEALPVDRKALYNYLRNSHVLVKELNR